MPSRKLPKPVKLNRYGNPIESDAARQRRYYAERDELIARIGMAPEDRSSPDNRYVATNGELKQWIREYGNNMAGGMDKKKAKWMGAYEDHAVSIGAPPGQIDWNTAIYLFNQGNSPKEAAEKAYGRRS